MRHLREVLLESKFHTTLFAKHGDVWFQPKLNSFNVSIEYEATHYCFWLSAEDVRVRGESEEIVKNRICQQLEELDEDGVTLDLVKLAVLL